MEEEEDEENEDAEMNEHLMNGHHECKFFSIIMVTRKPIN